MLLLSWKQLYTFQGKKLLVLGTSSRKDVLQEMEMANVFSAIVHVSNISSSEQLLTVLDNVDAFNEKELEIIRKKTTGKRYHIQYIHRKIYLNFTSLLFSTPVKNGR
jgi:hypothetical protein